MTSEEWLIAFGVVPDQKTIDSLDAALKEQRDKHEVEIIEAYEKKMGVTIPDLKE